MDCIICSRWLVLVKCVSGAVKMPLLCRIHYSSLKRRNDWGSVCVSVLFWQASFYPLLMNVILLRWVPPFSLIVWTLLHFGLSKIWDGRFIQNKLLHYEEQGICFDRSIRLLYRAFFLCVCEKRWNSLIPCRQLSKLVYWIESGIKSEH